MMNLSSIISVRIMRTISLALSQYQLRETRRALQIESQARKQQLAMRFHDKTDHLDTRLREYKASETNVPLLVLCKASRHGVRGSKQTAECTYDAQCCPR